MAFVCFLFQIQTFFTLVVFVFLLNLTPHLDILQRFFVLLHPVGSVFLCLSYRGEAQNQIFLIIHSIGNGALYPVSQAYPEIPTEGGGYSSPVLLNFPPLL